MVASAGGQRRCLLHAARLARNATTLAVGLDEDGRVPGSRPDEVVSRLFHQRGRKTRERQIRRAEKKKARMHGMWLLVMGSGPARPERDHTTPFYHPIRPLICDSDLLLAWPNRATTLSRVRAYRRPEDRSRMQLDREYHERVFGVSPRSVASEGSVSIRR